MIGLRGLLMDFGGLFVPPQRVQIMTEQTIAAAALKKTTIAERIAYLDGACADDAELRRRVEALLDSHFTAGTFVGGSAAAAETTCIPPLSSSPTQDTQLALTEGAGVVVGPYKLLQLIGEGGMGSVYMAEQEKPVRRRVALKIIKPGMDSDQVIARFEAERQALAMMDHQNIARVLDAGTTDTGRPYFVMELVHGVPITQYCDEVPAHLARTAGTVRTGLPGDPARAPERGHPPGYQALERARDAVRRQAGAEGH
jgi:eukaryotic-like serine/threonine-protein kinase